MATKKKLKSFGIYFKKDGDDDDEDEKENEPEPELGNRNRRTAILESKLRVILR